MKSGWIPNFAFGISKVLKCIVLPKKKQMCYFTGWHVDFTLGIPLMIFWITKKKSDFYKDFKLVWPLHP